MNLQQTADWLYADNAQTVIGQKDDRYGDRPDVHHCWPSGNGGPSVRGNKVKVTPNAHRAAHTYLALLDHFGGNVPWSISRHFAGARKGIPGIREIARLGADRIARQAM